jgi:hypothetical protein
MWSEYQDQELQVVGQHLEEADMLAEAGVLAELYSEYRRVDRILTKVKDYLKTTPVLTAYEVTTLIAEIEADE